MFHHHHQLFPLEIVPFIFSRLSEILENYNRDLILCQSKIFLVSFLRFLSSPLSLRFSASEVTLSGLAGGEYLPLPASKGLAFPFLLTLEGYPTSTANYAQGQGRTLMPPSWPSRPQRIM